MERRRVRAGCRSHRLASWMVLALAVVASACGPHPASSNAPASRPRVVPPTAKPTPTILEVEPGTLEAVLNAEDTDGNRRITVDDKGSKSFDVPMITGGSYRVTGTYPLSNLVQELALQRGSSRPEVPIARIFENPVDRLSRLVREQYWDGLTRVIDTDTLETVMSDEKMDARRGSAQAYAGLLDGCNEPNPPAQPRFLYVPSDDVAAYHHYAAMTNRYPWLVVCRLPDKVTPQWVQQRDAAAGRPSRHGLLSLDLDPHSGRPLPYVVPGGRFNELYGWDSYFHVLGLLNDGRTDLARSVVDNLVYEVDHYGQILNANRSYYLTRSQPPLLSSMVRAVWDAGQGRSLGAPGRAGARAIEGDLGWLTRTLLTTIREYESVWTSGPRKSGVCRDGTCLSRYHGAGIGQPPEVEEGHFSWLYAERARASGIEPDEYERRYASRKLPQRQLRELDAVFTHDRCMRESGHDTTYRWFDIPSGEDRCADYATVDLNSLLLKYELDVAHFIETAFGGRLRREDCESGSTPCDETTQRWCDRARARAALIRRYLWDPERSLFFDLNLTTKRRSSYVSATTLYPLWAQADNPCDVSLFEDEAAPSSLVREALRQLEQPGGIAATGASSVEPPQLALARRLGVRPADVARQWDYPNGWAPHQIVVWAGLRRHGFDAEADRLTYRWLSMIVQNARDHHGTVPEKFDVVRRTHRVFTEYGNVGTEFAYITREGFGWMNASYQLGLQALPDSVRQVLRRRAAQYDQDIPADP